MAGAAVAMAMAMMLMLMAMSTTHGRMSSVMRRDGSHWRGVL